MELVLVSRLVRLSTSKPVLPCQRARQIWLEECGVRQEHVLIPYKPQTDLDAKAKAIRIHIGFHVRVRRCLHY